MSKENNGGSAFPLHYRLRETLGPEGLLVKTELFTPIKETPQGYWVVSQYAPTWLTHDELRKRKFAKWVSKTSVKRYCYPDINSAIWSFKRRKEVQASRLRLQLEQAELALEKFAEYKDATVDQLKRTINIGNIPSHDRIVFDF